MHAVIAVLMYRRSESLADVVDMFPGPRTANAAYDVAGDARRLGLKLKKMSPIANFLPDLDWGGA